MEFVTWWITSMYPRTQHADMIVMGAILAVFVIVMYRASFR